MEKFDSEAILETIQHRMSNYRVIVVYFEEYYKCFNFAQIENTNILRKIRIFKDKYF